MQFYQQQAKRLRDIAKRSADAKLRESLGQIAEGYDRLSAELKAGNG
jgi:hypothetical protein